MDILCFGEFSCLPLMILFLHFTDYFKCGSRVLPVIFFCGAAALSIFHFCDTVQVQHCRMVYQSLSNELTELHAVPLFGMVVFD
jgi:hypothetical protein